ncbi:TonB-dependent receptor plug domain-containing protein [Arenimonas composti]|uniref:TonB-dependent receptor n=1 Tax=Arenimonas composti TR7-09 = DSM 18010 TaxID=1121013 RepID=A0A091BG33_9GAMM|nr:TonB-dependent receptor [Arenimonas composti]KFN50462.1 hypothetical protein P873_07305 [Arenimonas composti TR7-09 = DSM 18010]
MLRRKPPTPTLRPAAWLLAAAFAAPVAASIRDGDELANLSLEELADVQVTSVSRRAQRLADAAAAIQVITAEDIRRAGATRLPEALRLASNLQVARVGANTWAITARGFNNALGNKLLVLVDGRTVYTPLFSGVFWDSQDVMLEDVERIEVISGPGSTLWGANAVNGVINVITKRPVDTVGGLVAVGGGGEGDLAAVRWGGAFAGGHARAYARRYRLDDSDNAAGIALGDGWRGQQAGFRAEWGGDQRRFNLQGDVHRGESDGSVFGPVETSGFNLMARWRDIDADGDGWRLQAYYDAADRDDPLQFHDRMRVFDLEFLHAFRRGRHALVWGAGWRHARDHVQAGLITTFLPNRKSLDGWNVYVQDALALGERGELTLGLKLDHNDYTGAEWLPNLRFAWRGEGDLLLWGALSRAVRSPSRIDREFYLPSVPPFLIDGGPDFVSEIAHVAELGLRDTGGDGRLQYSLTAFHADYDRLRSGQPGGSGFRVENWSEGRVAGLELSGSWQVTPGWRLSGGGVRQWIDLRQKPGGLDPDGTTALGNDPPWYWQLRSSHTFGAFEFDLGVRGVAALPAPRVARYTQVDVGLGWRPTPVLSLRLQVLDALDEAQVEFQPGLLSLPAQFGRRVWAGVEWRW